MKTIHPLDVGDLVLVRDGPREITGFILEVYPAGESNLDKNSLLRRGGYRIQHPDGILIFVAPDRVSLLSPPLI